MLPRRGLRWFDPFRGLGLCGVVASLAVACSDHGAPATSTFYDRKIAPILSSSCARSPTGSGCHVAADDRGNALGNLDIQSYDTLAVRRDLFQTYGPYGVPGLLLKVAPPFELRYTTFDDHVIPVNTDVPHAGGSLIDLTSSSYTQLRRWIDNGAAENNAPDAPPERELLPCNPELGSATGFNPGADPPAPDYATFASRTNPVLSQRCAAGNCHGSPANSLYLTCGTTPEQQRWNYFAASDYVSVNVDQSEILRRAVAPGAGGTFHEGGTVFQNLDDPEWISLHEWALEKGGPTNVPSDAGFAFFSERVQPVLARRGCMMLGCHSPAMFHDYRLRGGSAGHFGLPATRRNYELSLEQLALESPDPNTSRIVRKNLVPGEGGILHRGGPLFGSGGDPTVCDPAAAETADINTVSDYCVIVTWIAKERQARFGAAAPLSHVVYVKRPPAPGPDRPQDWDQFVAGADLVRATATADATGAVTLGAEESLLGVCGLAAGGDVRRPAVSWDGARIAFSARASAAEPWRIYVIDGATCALEPTVDAPPTDDAGVALPSNGALVHNFDPAFAPDGRMVFTSTRGNVTNAAAFAYQGTQRSPADPSKLNANLYIVESGAIRQLTYLLDQELGPAFMNDGRLIFTTEKRAPGFYQLAARRENLDGGDYHPLFGQRATFGYQQITDVIELADKNFAAIASERGAAHGAGALVIVNRSIGVDQHSANEADYTVNAAAIDWPNPRFFQHGVSFPDGAATGRLSGTNGAYRSPSPLPDGKLLVSYAPGATDLAAFPGGFDLVVFDPVTNQRTALRDDATADLLWPVAVYARDNPLGVFTSRIGEPNGAARVYTDEARRKASEITFLDVPLIASLLFQNTRTGRRVETTGALEVWESLPPEAGVTSFADGGGFVTSDDYGPIYARRQLLGAATLEPDNSLRVKVPGGKPITLALHARLAGDSDPTYHFQREAMQFYPGEVVRQGFRRELFNGVCAGCHGSISGYESQVVVNPDILTQASAVDARNSAPRDLTSGGNPPKGPPFP